MSQLPPASDFNALTSGVAPVPLEGVQPDALARKWLALHRAAAAVAELTGHGAEELPDPGIFAATVAQLPAGRRRLIDEGLSDLIAVMEPGLTALLSIHQRGGDASTSAKALWREFVSAREAVQSLTR